MVSAAADVAVIRYCAGATADGANTYNVLDVVLAEGIAAPEPSIERNFFTTSSCGVCGKASLEAVRTVSRWTVAHDPVRLSAATIATLPDRLRAAQRVFDRTGGLHAAALFDADGDLLMNIAKLDTRAQGLLTDAAEKMKLSARGSRAACSCSRSRCRRRRRWPWIWPGRWD